MSVQIDDLEESTAYSSDDSTSLMKGLDSVLQEKTEIHFSDSETESTINTYDQHPMVMNVTLPPEPSLDSTDASTENSVDSSTCDLAVSVDCKDIPHEVFREEFKVGQGYDVMDVNQLLQIRRQFMQPIENVLVLG